MRYAQVRLRTGQAMATHGFHEHAPIGLNVPLTVAAHPRTRRGLVTAFMQAVDLVFTHAAQLTPHAHAGHANGLKLPNAPARRPRIYAAVAGHVVLLHIPQLALDHIQVVCQRCMAHALGDVLGHIASGTAMGHALAVHAVFKSAGLVAKLGQPPHLHGQLNVLRLSFCLCPNQHVPMGRGIVVRLCHTNAVNLDPLGVQVRTQAAPAGAQPLLRITRGAHTVIAWVGVGLATLANRHGVELAGRCLRKEQAHMVAGAGVLFGTANARHQLAAPNDGVRR